LNKSKDTNQALVDTDMYLKRYSHQALLDIFYRQSKTIKDIQITYNKNTQLRIAYWPACTGNLILSIGSQGLEISHSPHLESSINFSKEISEMLHQAISVYKKQRLLNLFPRGRYDKRLYITLRGEECILFYRGVPRLPLWKVFK
jgi:hypothetical protein